LIPTKPGRLRTFKGGAKKMTAQDDTIAGISDSNVTDAGMYLFYAVLAAIGSLAALIILVAVLTLLLTKLGFGNILKMK